VNKILQRLNDHVNTVDAALHGYIDVKKDVPQPLFDSVRYSLFAGGKRIRPALTIEFCRLFGGSDAHAIPFACAVECLHTYSLIHDDLPCMDNDDLRRGQVTNHRLYGESTALLAGDGLLTFAFELLSTKSCAPAQDTLRAIQVLSYYAGINGMVGGQQLDLNGEKEAPDFDGVRRTHRLKTGALMKAACLMGCCAAGVSNDRNKWQAASEYADHLGMAFQILDDILDCTGTVEILGKEINQDTKKVTFMNFMTAEEGRAYAAMETATACRALDFYPNNEFLVGLANHLIRRNK
jgi:geranylgeranyl diphosphate synthase type II